MASLVHRCNFVEWVPEAVNALAVSPSGTRPMLAAVRANGDFEIWDVTQNWLVHRIPAGHKVGRGIEAVVWLEPTEENRQRTSKGKKSRGQEAASPCPFKVSKKMILPWAIVCQMPMGRVFTAGRDGMIVEWCLDTFEPLRTTVVDGGAIWCMVPSPDGRRLAVACEDGSVRMVRVKTLEVISRIAWGQGRILSMAWNDTDPTLLAIGRADGTIGLWDLKASHWRHCVKVEGENRRRGNALIWTLIFVEGDIKKNKNVLVSGSSTGLTQFWDVETGTQLRSFDSHRADILSLVLHPTQQRIFAAGVDRRIVEFALVEESDSARWILASSRSYHTHDIRALAFVTLLHPNIESSTISNCHHYALVSAGVDAKIMLCNPIDPTSQQLRRVSPYPQNSPISLARSALLMSAALSGASGALASSNSSGSVICIWALGRPREEAILAGMDKEKKPRREDQEGGVGENLAMNLEKKCVPFAQPGRLILQMKIPQDESVIMHQLSSDGQLMAYCTRSALRVYRLELKKDPKSGLCTDLNLTKMMVPSIVGTPRCFSFSPDGTHLAVVLIQRNISHFILYQIDTEGLNEVYRIELASKTDLSSEQRVYCVERMVWQGSFIALHDTANVLTVVDVSKGRVVERRDDFNSFLTLLQFLPTQEGSLLMVTAENHLFLQDLLNPSSSRSWTDLPYPWTNPLRPLIGLTVPLESVNPLRIQLWSDESIYTIDLSRPIPTNEEFVASIHATPPTLKRKSFDPLGAHCQGSLSSTDRYGHLLFLSHLNHHEMIVVQRDLTSIQEALHAPFHRKSYGGL